MLLIMIHFSIAMVWDFGLYLACIVIDFFISRLLFSMPEENKEREKQTLWISCFVTAVSIKCGSINPISYFFHDFRFMLY